MTHAHLWVRSFVTRLCVSQSWDMRVRGGVRSDSSEGGWGGGAAPGAASGQQ